MRTRRSILQAGLSGLVGSAIPQAWPLTSVEAAGTRRKLPVAAVVSVYTPNSHADVLAGKILEGYQQDGGAGPDLELVSLFTDQVPPQDMSREKAKRHGFRISETIDDALTFGTDRLQVAGVLCIGEHGQYELTPETGQRMYPRRRFFDDVVQTFRRCDEVVPVFNDKHLAYRWNDAKTMYETARELNIPFLAGSSLPVAWREPSFVLAAGAEVEAALSIGYGGFEDYGFHALEAHQCLLEKRRGGTGIRAVRALKGERLRESEAAGLWSSELFAAARKRMPGYPEDTASWKPAENSAVYLLEHQDGFRSAVIMANGLADQFTTALKIKEQAEPVGTWFRLQEVPPFGHFACLLRAIDHTFHTRVAAYPIERTLLTTGILDRIMQSLAQNGRRIETPELAIEYSPTDWPYANQNSGSSCMQ
ncbi:MAG: hypothetical protein U0936_17140 [Planctomycetaceae bacterium]